MLDWILANLEKIALLKAPTQWLMERFRRPRLQVVGFDNVDNITWIDVHTGYRSDQISYWIRMRIQNLGKKSVKNCRVKLMEVEPRQNHFNPLQLLWVRSGEQQQPTNIDLDSKDERIFDVGFTKKSDNIFHIHPADWTAALNSVIDYPRSDDRKFVLRLFSDNYKTVTISFVLLGAGHYNEFRYDSYQQG